MSKIAVVFHSGYGHTRRVAEYVAEGAGAELLAIDAEGNLPEGAWEKLADAEAILTGADILPQARSAVVAALGEAAMIDAAAVVAGFNGITRIADTTRAAGKIVGTWCATVEDAILCRDLGYQFITISSDSALMTLGAKAQIARFRDGA